MFLCSATTAASADALLSNLDESSDVGIVVGTPADSSTPGPAEAIRFQTGSGERGYNITSVKAVLVDAAASDGVRVRIFRARSNGTPYLSLYTLSNPTIADGTLTFNAPASAYLKSNTPYFVVFDSTAWDTGDDYEIRGTESESLNSAATGWSLNTDRHSGTEDSTYWTTGSAVPLIEISGDAVVRSNDATLSALSMSDGTPRFVTVLSPGFDTSMTSYTSSAAAVIDQITIEGTATNADGATVAYLDGDDQTLADADGVKEGFQVDLEVGANTIKVRVTAEDGTTTRTYTLVVTRDEPLASPDALLSNLDEPNVTSLYAGTPTRKIRWTLAVGFETGSNEGGYTLTSVKGVVSFNTASSGMRVRIFSSTAEGRPGDSLYTLSSTANNIGVRTFEAPADATLESDTSYLVVFDTANSRVGKYYKLREGLINLGFAPRVGVGGL
ncbi:MAG: cadherin-like beta sandwich domain-containing protein, partial [Gammaproteobacteria bacterium]|nr:cadherin-like beta sandwich domain-containing protein [Gammaproteobacteria bacterium]